MTRSWLSPDSVGLLGGVIHDLLHVFGHHSQRLNEWSSDQVRHWCVGFYLSFTDWSAMIHGETETYRFWLTMVDERELLCFIDRYWSAFLKIEGKQNSPTVIVPISTESSSHQHQPRKSKILQVFQKLQWSSFRTHHISHHVASSGAQLERKWAQQRLFQSPRVGWKNPWGNTSVTKGQNTMLVLHCGNGYIDMARPL